MKSQSDHVGVLDGLRALAILLVLASHGLEMVWLDLHKPYMPFGSFDLAAFLKNGYLGVDLFFVLSGFLITGQLLDGGIAVAANRWQVIVNYLIRRAARIIPAYYLILTFTTVIFMGHDPLGRGAASWAHSYIFHLLFLHNYFYPDYYPLFWSLAVEFQFYLLAPFFIIAVQRVSRPALRYLSVFGVILILALLRTAVVLRFGNSLANSEDWSIHIKILLPFCLDGILGGVLCNMLWRDEKISAFMRRAPVCNSLFFGGLLLFLSLARHPPMENGITLFDKTLLPCFAATGFCCMVLGLLAGSAGQRTFSSRPLRYIARVSYGMYLLHIIIMRDIFTLTGSITAGIHNHFIIYCIGFLFFLALALLLASIMYYACEKPVIDWAKKRTGKSMQT